MNILAITGPIYLTILLGFFSTQRGIFSKADGQVLGRFVLNYGLPAMIFNALSSRSFQEVMHPSYLVAYGLGSLMSFSIGLSVWRWVKKRSINQSALIAMGVSGSNSGYVGYPIMMQLLGPTAGVGLALCMLIENFLIIPLGLGIADSDGAEKTSFVRLLMQSLVRLSKIPMMWGMALGLVCSLLGIHLPEVVVKTVNLLAASCAGLALFINGGALVGLEIKGLASEVIWIALGKLIMHPACVGLFLLLVGPLEHDLQISALVYASMPMMGIYPIIAQRYGHQGLAAAALLMATMLSFFTISGLLLGLHGLGV